MNKQREILYGFRKEVLLSEAPKEILLDIVFDEIEKQVNYAENSENNNDKTTGFNKDALLHWLNMTFPLAFIESDLTENGEFLSGEKLVKKVYSKVENAYNAKEAVEDLDSLRHLERYMILDAVDRLWQEHLYAMDGLRSGIMLRSYAQKDPLVEYKHEAFEMFSAMMNDMNQEILNNMFRSATRIEAFEQLFANLPQELIHKEIEQFENENSGYSQIAAHHMQQQQQQQMMAAEGLGYDDEMAHIETYHRDDSKVGRNDPCPCGSGRKYKKCCGK